MDVRRVRAAGERLDPRSNVSDLRPESRPAGEPVVIVEGGLRVAVRPPDSRDLAAIVQAGTLEAARRLLLERAA